MKIFAGLAILLSIASAQDVFVEDQPSVLEQNPETTVQPTPETTVQPISETS